MTEDGKDAYHLGARGRHDQAAVRVSAGEIRLDGARLRYQDGRAFLSNASAAAWKRKGRLETSGEWDDFSRRYSLEGKVTGVKCDELFNETWAKRFIGDASSDFVLDNQIGLPAAHGHLTIRNGTLTALPVLDALAAYADTLRRFRVLSLSDAHADWNWLAGDLSLSNLVLASEGLIRLEKVASTSVAGTSTALSRLGLASGHPREHSRRGNRRVFAPGERRLALGPVTDQRHAR